MDVIRLGNKKVYFSGVLHSMYLHSKFYRDDWRPKVVLDSIGTQQLIESVPMPSCPIELQRLEFFACTAIDRKIYIVGGRGVHDGLPSEKALVYDTTSNEWEVHPCKFKVNRGCNPPVLIAVGKTLYLFGDPPITWPATMDDFAEFYDLEDVSNNSKTATWEWKPISGPPPLSDEIYDPYYQVYLLNYALYRSKHQILLWFCWNEPSDYVVCTFDYLHRTWGRFHTSINDLSHKVPNQVLIVDHLLFCYHSQAICAYDLRTHQTIWKEPIHRHCDMGTAAYDEYRDIYDQFLLSPDKDTLVIVDHNEPTLLHLCRIHIERLTRSHYDKKELLEEEDEEYNRTDYRIGFNGCSCISYYGHPFIHALLIPEPDPVDFVKEVRYNEKDKWATKRCEELHEEMVQLMSEPRTEGEDPISPDEAFNLVAGTRSGYAIGLGHGVEPQPRRHANVDIEAFMRRAEQAEARADQAEARADKLQEEINALRDQCSTQYQNMKSLVQDLMSRLPRA